MICCIKIISLRRRIRIDWNPKKTDIDNVTYFYMKTTNLSIILAFPRCISRIPRFFRYILEWHLPLLESSIGDWEKWETKYSRSSRAMSMSLFLSVSKVVSKISFSSSSLAASFRNCSTCISIWSNRPTNLSFGFGSLPCDRCSCSCCSLSIVVSPFIAVSRSLGRPRDI